MPLSVSASLTVPRSSVRRTVMTSLVDSCAAKLLEPVVDDRDPVGHQLLRRLGDRSGRGVVEVAPEGDLTSGQVPRRAAR